MNQRVVSLAISFCIVVLLATACGGPTKPKPKPEPVPPYPSAPYTTPTRILFQVSYDPTNGYEIYVMNSDGTNPVPLTKNPSLDTDPAWSPDTTKIAFVRWDSGPGETYVMNPDGSNQMPLNGNVAGALDPAWSLDGKKIAFARRSSCDFDCTTGGIYVMNADGSDPVQLTTTTDRSGPHDSDPAWSPDGTKIAYERGHYDSFQPTVIYTSGIWVMNSDGSNQVPLTQSAGWDIQPAWSPDGRRIAFTSGRHGNLEIYVMNADGSNQVRLTNSVDNDQAPAWSPDGKRIVFASEWQICVMNADGTNQLHLTSSLLNGCAHPSWGPRK